MRKWGLVITLFYGLIVVILLLPGFVLLLGDYSSLTGFFDHVQEGFAAWGTWITVAILVASEALLLFLRVDTSFKRLKPRAHILVSTTMAAFFLALLTFAGAYCVALIPKGDWASALIDRFLNGGGSVVGAGLFIWLFWGIVFYLFCRNSNDIVSRAVTWLLRGSVLELLIAVPAHVIVRRRHDCSAPIVTSFGITSGIAIMLLSFGPSVLLLFKKRMEIYSVRGAAAR
jgi:uncharacterized membrane protein